MNASMIGTVTVALGALAALAAVIYQAVTKGAIDGELLGFTGLLFGAFLRSPGGTDRVEIRQPADQPVPTTEV